MVHQIKYKRMWLMPFLLILLVSNASGFSLSSGIAIGKIVPLEGLIVVRRKTQGITVKPPAMKIYRGDEVLTNENGKARILLTGGNEVFVGPSSTLLLNKSFQDRYKYTYNLNLKGKLRAKVQRVRGRRFRVKTSTAVIDVKGTDFIVDSLSQSTQVATFKGLVQLTSLKTKKKVDIAPGRMSSVTKVGTVLKPKKVELIIVKNLENTGKTGIKELDTVMKPPPPLDPSIKFDIETEPLPVPLPEQEQKPAPKVVAKAEPQVIAAAEQEPEPEEPVSAWAYAEEYRMRNRFGFGFGAEAGMYSGSLLFAEFNLTPRSQLHIHISNASRESGAYSNAIDEGGLQRELSVVTYRRFMADSGFYLGGGYGTAYFKQEFDDGYGNFEVKGYGSFFVIGLGAQTYGNAYNTTFYVNVGTQVLFNVGFNDEPGTGTLSGDDYDEFTRQAKEEGGTVMLAFGWFF